ncbi:MAG: ABC transporter permease [Calditrichaeota bacterium]|nr:MAG: ABC transporter permease [Calditrichota bacterium]
MKFSRVLPIIKKEFYHIRRDFRTLIIVIVMPVVMLFLYGFALNLEIQNIEMLVLDHDKSPESRELVRKFEGSKFFTVHYFSNSESHISDIFANRRARMVLIIPFDFSRRLYRGLSTSVQVIIDASDSNAALLIRNYSNAVFQRYNLEQGVQPLFDVETSIWYNPTMKSSHFFVPGLAALILVMISALLTSIAIVREKETGTMEQILVSPIRPSEIIFGKVVPYIILAFIDLLIILTIAHLVYKVPFIGNLVLLLFASLVFIFVALSLGLLISTIARTQQVAMMMALMATLLPTVILSGFIFPIDSFPRILKMITYVVPARYFLIIIRGIMLKGNTFMQLFPEIATLLLFGIFLLVVSVKKFQTTLEV